MVNRNRDRAAQVAVFEAKAFESSVYLQIFITRAMTLEKREHGHRRTVEQGRQAEKYVAVQA